MSIESVKPSKNLIFCLPFLFLGIFESGHCFSQKYLGCLLKWKICPLPYIYYFRLSSWFFCALRFELHWLKKWNHLAIKITQGECKEVRAYHTSRFQKASSVQFSHSVESNSLQPHEPQHTRPPCPSPTPGIHPNPCPLTQWCHPTISDVPFSSHRQSFPASGRFPTNQFFTSGGQSIGVSASASVLPKNIQGWFPLGCTGWISLQSKGLSWFPRGEHRRSRHRFLWAPSPLLIATGEAIPLRGRKYKK